VSGAEALAYVSAGAVALWGIAHVIPTRQVVSGFGRISRDNRLVITQEWVAEALTMWFIAGVVVIATSVAGSGEPITVWVYRAAAIMLAAVGALTAVTGAKTPVVWFKICPVLLGSSAALLLAASFL
jgi:hypothetical protein